MIRRLRAILLIIALISGALTAGAYQAGFQRWPPEATLSDGRVARLPAADAQACFKAHLLVMVADRDAIAVWRGWRKRYTHFVSLMLVIVAAGLYAESSIGLAAVAFGLLAVLGVVRRWTWVENDRETFIIERGERKVGESVLRVGFREDLRDEAMVALACLFVLIPLGLDQVQQFTCAGGACAFSFGGGVLIPKRQLWACARDGSPKGRDR